jgi:hypothetical protein
MAQGGDGACNTFGGLYTAGPAAIANVSPLLFTSEQAMTAERLSQHGRGLYLLRHFSRPVMGKQKSQ